MNLKSALIAVSMASIMAPAIAADQAIDLSSGFASFGSTSPLLAGGDDVLSFINLASGTYDFAVSVNGQFITDLAASINGIALDVTNFGVFRFAYLEGQSPSPLTLTVTGSTIISPLASYAVTMSATPVPEPQTYLLMTLGLATLGWVAHRRSRA